MANKWIEHIRTYAKNKNISYSCAVSDPDCSKTYKEKQAKTKEKPKAEPKAEVKSEVKAEPKAKSKATPKKKQPTYTWMSSAEWDKIDMEKREKAEKKRKEEEEYLKKLYKPKPIIKTRGIVDLK